MKLFPLEMDGNNWRSFVTTLALPLLFAGVLLAWTLLAVWYVGRVTLARIFPRAWAIDWDARLALDPTFDTACPRCAAPLTLGVVDARGLVVRSDHGTEHAFPTQTATCAPCGRTFKRLGFGKIWHGWQDRTP